MTTKRSKKELKKLKLGEEKTIYSDKYDPSILESFANKNPKSEAWTTFICHEFTSLCPKTGQPDFGRLVINYIANKKMIESKALKLYLFSFRNHGDFHEDCVQKICNDLANLIKPKYLEVVGEFNVRGGIAIFPYSCYAAKQSKYQELKNKRFERYAPGKYGLNK